MKFKVLVLSAFIILGSEILLHAAPGPRSYPKTQNPGAVEIGTMTAVAVATNPVQIISTGTGTSGYGYYTDSGVVGGFTPAFYLDQRMFVEIFNDSGQDIWVGFDQNVSSTTGANYGRRIPHGAAWSNDGSLLNYWAVSSASTTARKVVVTQER